MTTQPKSSCSKRVFEDGETVFIIHSLPSTAIEAIVIRLREELQFKDIDWHFVGGRACVKVLPGRGKRSETICTEVRSRLDYLQYPLGGPL